MPAVGAAADFPSRPCSARPQAAPAEKTMNRTGLIIALAIAAVVGVVFGLYPQLDLMIAAPFHAMVAARQSVRPAHLSAVAARPRHRVVGGNRGDRPGGGGAGAQVAAAAATAVAVGPRHSVSDGDRRARPGAAGQCRTQGSLGPAAADRSDAIRRPLAFCRLVGSARRVRQELLVRVRRRLRRVLDNRTGGAGAAAMAGARLWRGADAGYRHGGSCAS